MSHSNLIAVGLSGGVDSSVAALLLKQRGVDLIGLHMKNWEDEGTVVSECPAELDRRDAVRIAGQLGIRFQGCNFVEEYRRDVWAHVLAEYAAGRTPNPDILCNREIKFKAFLQHALDLGAEKVATGHYARVDCQDGRWRLLRGKDANKDQTFFLHALGQYELAHALFPVGELPKPEVRRLAAEAGFATARKKDSVGICFIGERDMRSFLAEYLKTEEGDFVTPDGQVVGRHSGCAFYTIGQRGGLGIGGVAGVGQGPWYVAGKRLERNEIIVVQGGEHPALAVHEAQCSQATWTAGHAPANQFEAVVKYRHRQPDQAVEVTVDGTRVRVRFKTTQYGVAPGQSMVFYDGEECLGGAVIDATDAVL